MADGRGQQREGKQEEVFLALPVLALVPQPATVATNGGTENWCCCTMKDWKGEDGDAV